MTPLDGMCPAGRAHTKDASSEHTALGWDPTSSAFQLVTWGKPLICLLMRVRWWGEGLPLGRVWGKLATPPLGSRQRGPDLGRAVGTGEGVGDQPGLGGGF